MDKYINTYNVIINKNQDGELLDPNYYIRGINGLIVYRKDKNLLNIFVPLWTDANRLCNLIWDSLTEECQNSILELRRSNNDIPDAVTLTIYETNLSKIDDILLLDGLSNLKKPREIRNLPRQSVPYIPKDEEKYKYVKESINVLATIEANKGNNNNYNTMTLSLDDGDSLQQDNVQITPSDYEYNIINNLLLDKLNIREEYTEFSNTSEGFGYTLIDFLDKTSKLDEAIDALRDL